MSNPISLSGFLARNALIAYALASGLAYGGEAAMKNSWEGDYVRTLTEGEQSQLTKFLRVFFGRSKAAILEGAGADKPLFDQFESLNVDLEYRLPSGRRVVQGSDGPKGDRAIVVTKTRDLNNADQVVFGQTDVVAAEIIAAAMLTHSCPKNGVEETYVTSTGVKYKQHFECELDYSLLIFYEKDVAPDALLNMELMKWAQATADGSPGLWGDKSALAALGMDSPARKPGVKTIVKTLSE